MTEQPPPMPEPTGAGPQPAGVPRPGELVDRFLARLIDGVILGVAYAILYFVVAAIVISGFSSTGELFLVYIIVGPITAVLWLGYYAYLESSSGATIGKMALKLKVVGPDGVSNPTLEQAVRRNIWNAFPLAFVVPVVGPILGGLAALVAEIMIAVGINNDPVHRQAWHDKFAGGTKVLKIG